MINRFLQIGLLLAWSVAACSAEPTWVRVLITDPDEARLSSDLALADYGAFAWGQLSPSEMVDMKQQGLMISAPADPFTLQLGGERFDPLVSARAVGPWTDYQPDPAGDFYLVQFGGPVRPEWLQSVRASGVELTQPLHPFSHVVWASQEEIAAVGQRTELRWLGPMLPAWKVQPQWRQLGPDIKDTMLLTSSQAETQEVLAELSRLGQVISSAPSGATFNVVHMALAGDRYLDLAALPFVYTVQAIPPNAAPRGETSNQSVAGGIDNTGIIFSGYADWLSETGFDGSGVIVSVIDSPVLATHLDLADRMLPCLGENASCNEQPPGDHGTHVASALAGTGASGITLHGFLRGQGMAPGAGLVSQIWTPFQNSDGPGGLAPDGMLNIYEDAARSGALLANNSWGASDTPQGYDIPTRQVDLITRDADPDRPGQHPILAVWSIMNGNGDGDGACAPSSLGAPDEAKNLLAVGSNWLLDGSGAQGTDIYSLSENSGHGPACDGRRVPHLVAPGCSTDGAITDSDSAHAFNYCGTSHASPIVTGAIAVWAEKFSAEKGAPPSPALAKAVFVGAARDLAGSRNADGDPMGHRPDRFQGYGRLDLQAVMDSGSPLFTHDQATVLTASGQARRFRLSAADPAAPIRIMLAWTDAPGHGLGGSTPAWVNNLDLLVQADGLNYVGNDVGTNGWSAPGGTPDERNNLEAVYLSPDQHRGAITIIVSAAEIAGDALTPWQPSSARQDFALACFNCRAELFQDRFEAKTGDIQP
ncbi:S8 family serine peptidase [Wenzhouxiangella sp. EGI_FJ10305]|uniref:S8 family serine peptidase n=1 Tax=Wenzhouxiangella sp. EGI_FJ10305 TaxID=3243768 RepID=UPI0035DD2375